MKIRNGIKVFLPFIVLATAVALVFYLVTSKPERKQPELKEKVWQVDVIEASRQTLSPDITLYGRVESPEQLQAAAPGAGIVETVRVRTGDKVLQGQTLLTLDQRDFNSLKVQANSELSDIQSQIEELKIRQRSNKASLETEQELLRLAEAEVERMRQLKNQNLGSATTLSEARSVLGRQQLSLQNRQLEVDSFPARLRMLEARLINVRTRLGDAERMIERSEVTAAFDAVISSVPVSVGDRVAIGQTLITLYPVDSLEIRAHIPATYVADIQVALKRGDTPEASLTINKQQFIVDLKRLAGEAEATGTDAYFHTGELSRELRPGTLLPLRLSLPPTKEVIPVPFQAIYGNSRIYLLRNGRLQGIDVETFGQFYQSNGDALLLIKSEEIVDGENIVITHLPNAVTGLKVKKID
ncbi:MAG: biotin/lipoyl-binding protein [Gammaproteobacteria bacterium]|nr:biotin/lipoyl-binding protein [Gammaproteobacteria bacterium]